MFPIIIFFGFTEGVLRLLFGGPCDGGKSVHIHNIFYLRFFINIALPFICNKFTFVTKVVGVFTHNEDFWALLEGMGGTVNIIIDPAERKEMLSVQIFMLEMHTDVVNYVKGVTYLDIYVVVIDTSEYISWEEATRKLYATFSIDPTFKFVAPNGNIVDSEDVGFEGNGLPEHTVTLNADDWRPTASLVRTSPLFFILQIML